MTDTLRSLDGACSGRALALGLMAEPVGALNPVSRYIR
jgi:hypothetical protein